MLALAAVAALTCAEAAGQRDTVSVLFLAAATQGGHAMAGALGAELPPADSLLDRIRSLDARLADCNGEGAVSASRRGTGSR